MDPIPPLRLPLFAAAMVALSAPAALDARGVSADHLPALGAVPDLGWLPEAEARCLGGSAPPSPASDGGQPVELSGGPCAAAVRAHLSYALASRSMRWTLSAKGQTAGTLPCPDGLPGPDQGRLQACVAASHPDALLLIDGDLAVMALPLDAGRARLVYLSAGPPQRDAPAGGDLPEGARATDFDRGGPVDVLAEEVVGDPRLVSLMAGAKEDGASAFAGGWSQEGALEHAPPDRLVSSRPLRSIPLLVCADRIVHPPALPLAAVGLAPSGSPFDPSDRIVSPRYIYQLPCAAQLRLDPGVTPVRLGPRAPEPWGSPPKVEPGGPPGEDGRLAYGFGPVIVTAIPYGVTGRVGGRDCIITAAGAPLAEANFCSVTFAGDLDGDTLPEVSLHLEGEMGCGYQGLLRSTPEGGYALLSLFTWDC